MDSTPPSEESLRSLREALRLSPENLPLRQHLAETLLGYGRGDEAEKEFRHALSMSPGHPQLKLGLARSFNQQGKTSHAMALLDELVQDPQAPGQAFVLHARLLFSEGDVEQAVRQYRIGMDRAPSAVDLEFAARLGIDADEEVVEGKVRASWDDPEPDVVAEIERPRLTFADVGGMDAVKEEIQIKIIHPLAHPEMYKAYGKKTGGGILMYGPPGCGKTYLARATAGEIKSSFIAVGINEVLEMWIGNSERNLHDLFEQARRNKPCVLFFDEVDALGASRSDMRQHGGRHLINQFLAEMDGIKADNDGVLVLGATNAPWHLDAAFRRPGRFDRVLFVPPPDAPARAEVLRLHVRNKPVENVDFDLIAKKTADFSGADLSAVVDAAVEAKLREAIKHGVPHPLRTKDLATAAARLKATTKEWFFTARNHALYSNQGGIYDDILKYLKI